MGDTDRIVFSPPDITEDEIEEVIKALKSGWITTGPKCKELETMMAEYCHTNRLALMNSATACMEMTYRLFGIGEGDEVIVPAYTYTATASAVCHVGAKPVFVDILGDRAYGYEDGTHSPYEPDYEALEKAITPATKAITPVDIAGVMCDYDRIRDIAISKQDMFTPGDNKYQRALGRILILADSAHGFGSKRAGYMSGEAADFTSFSFHAVKNLTTAEGGGVTWRELPGIDDDEIYRMYMLLSLHGQSKDALAKEKIGSWEYDILFPGYKCNMTDIQAAIGLAQIRRYPELLNRRSEIVKRYDEGIARINERLHGGARDAKGYMSALAHETDEYTSVKHLYLLRVAGFSHEERSALISEMAAEGIPTNVHYKPLPLLTAYRDMGYDIKDYPSSYSYYENEITLPLHTLLRDEDIDMILKVLESSVARAMKE